MRLSTIGAVFVCVFLSCATPRPAAAYYDDTHYSFNYYLARACGYTPEQAHRIASACVRIDYSAPTEPNQYGNVFNPFAGSGTAQRPRIWFHAFMDNMKYPNCLKDMSESKKARADIMKQQEALWTMAKKTRNLGAFLHFLQDETSHYGYSSWGGHWASWGAYTSELPLGPTCDFLAFEQPGRHYEPINRTLDYMIQFMKAGSNGQQKQRSLNRATEIIPVLLALREANEAPRPIGKRDALLIGLAIAGKSAPLALEAVMRIYNLKSGPDMDKANSAIKNALNAWNEMKMFPTEPLPFEYRTSENIADGHLLLVSPIDSWTLFGRLRVTAKLPSSDALVTIKLAKTRLGEQEYELAHKMINSSGVVEFADLPVGEVNVELSRNGKVFARKERVLLSKLRNEMSFISKGRYVLEAPPQIDPFHKAGQRNLGILKVSENLWQFDSIPGMVDFHSTWRFESPPTELNPGQVFKLTATGTASTENTQKPPNDRTLGEYDVRLTALQQVSREGGHATGLWRGGPPNNLLEWTPQSANTTTFKVPAGGAEFTITERVTSYSSIGSTVGVYTYKWKEGLSPVESNPRPPAQPPSQPIANKPRSDNQPAKSRQQPANNNSAASNRPTKPITNQPRPPSPITSRKPATAKQSVSAADRAAAKEHFTKGNSLAEQGKWPEAEAEFLESTKLDPSDPFGWAELGAARVEQQKWGPAETAIREAIRIAPTISELHADLAEALLRQGKRDEAKKEALEAIRLGEKDHPVIKELGLRP